MSGWAAVRQERDMAGGSMFLERKDSWDAVISLDVSFPPAHEADVDV